ncbi:MAG: alpha/beta hydrolase family protein [Gaiellales bacterium]
MGRGDGRRRLACGHREPNRRATRGRARRHRAHRLPDVRRATDSVLALSSRCRGTCRGIAVMATNIRGSTGYGKSYQRLVQRDWGGGDMKDWEHAVKWLHAQDWVDADRIGVYGGSYGGFAVLTCVTRLPDYWAAAVDIVGPSNLITAAKAVPPTWRRMMKRFMGDPDEDADMLRERSPMTYIENAKTPLLVIQGAKDPRVVKPESDQLVEKLRSLGREVEYVVFEDEGHGFTKRQNEVKAMKLSADWLERHLAGD